MMLIVLCSFLATVLPVMILNTWDRDCSYPNLRVIFDILLWSASVINPFIYCFKNEKYRKAVVSLCRKIICLTELSENAEKALKFASLASQAQSTLPSTKSDQLSANDGAMSNEGVK